MRVQFLWQPRNSKNCRQLPNSVSDSDCGWVRNLRAQKIIKKTKNHNKVEHITRCRSCRGCDTCFVCRNRTKLKTNRKLKTEKENMKTWKLKTTNEFSAERLLLWGFVYFTLGLLHLQLAGLAIKMMAPAGSLPGQNSGRDWRHSRKHVVVVYGPPLTDAFYYIVCCELIAHALIYLYRQLCVCVCWICL